MEKKNLDMSQTFGRLSSASTESDYIPAMVPFDWETAPGKPAAARREIMEELKLPLPPGKRPKDGFFLPILKPEQDPNLQNKKGRLDSSLQETKRSNRKLYGSSKRRKAPKVGEGRDFGEGTRVILNPLSARRFGSTVAGNVLVESQKSSSWFRRCLPFSRKASSSHDHQRGEKVLGFGEDSCRNKPDATPELFESPSSLQWHGHGRSLDSSRTQAGNQLQTPSSRFNMASMLMALLPSESEESPEFDQDAGGGNEITEEDGDKAIRLAQDVGGGNEITEEDGDKAIRLAQDVGGGNEITEEDGDKAIRLAQHLSIPKVSVSSPRKSKELPKDRPRSDDFTDNSEKRDTLTDDEGDAADAQSLRNPSDMGLLLSPTHGLHHSSFTRIACDQVNDKQDPSTASGTPKAEESEEFASEGFAQGDVGSSESGDKSGEDIEYSSTDSFEYIYSKTSLPTEPQSSPVSSSSRSPKPTSWMVSEETLKLSRVAQQTFHQQQSHESPRSSFMLDEETTSSSPNTDFEQITATTSRITGAHDDSHPSSQDYDSKGKSLAVDTPNPISIEAQGEPKVGVGSSSTSFPIYLRRRGGTIITANTISSDDESEDDSDITSMNSFGYANVRATSIPSSNMPILCKFNMSLGSETWVVSEEVLKEVHEPSSSLQRKLLQQLQSMGLQTKSMEGDHHFENKSSESLEHETPRALLLSPSSDSPVFSKFNISLEPDSWVVHEEVFEKKSNPLRT